MSPYPHTLKAPAGALLRRISLVAFGALLFGATALSAAPAGFLFATFKGEQTPMTEQVYFSVSRDGRSWKALNGGRPALISEQGEKGVRDPYLLRSHDGSKFYLIATDLSINLNPDWTRAVTAGSRNIVVWESPDLVDWSEPRLIAVAPEDAGCAWAPEAIYDEENGDYIAFWASTTGRDNFAKHRIWAARTKDFKTFGEPFIFIEKPNTVIDTTIINDGKAYYRFTKDEQHKNILMETAPRLAGPWIDVPDFSLAHLIGYEGPECYLLEPASNGQPARWCLILDQYSKGAGYQPYVTSDLASGQFAAAEGFDFPFHFRHGSVIPLSAAELERIEDKWGGPSHAASASASRADTQANRHEDYPLLLPNMPLHDPYIVAHEPTQTYYLYTRNVPQLTGEKGLGTMAYTSKDLKHWAMPRVVFRVPEDAFAQEGNWAPEVHEYKGKFYLFVTLHDSEAYLKRPPDAWRDTYVRGTIAAVSESPDGPFEMLNKDGPVAPKELMTLDGTLYVDDDGQPWMVYAHEWLQRIDGTMEAVKLSPDLSRAVGEPIHLFKASDAPWLNQSIKVSDEGLHYVTDGPQLFRTKTGQLLMLWSSYESGSYVQTVARSESGELSGPWEQLDSLVKRDSGHGMLFRAFEGELMMVLHRPFRNARGKLYSMRDLGDRLEIIAERTDLDGETNPTH